MPSAADAPIPFCEDEATWERWLERHHASSDGVWLKFAKKTAPIGSVTHAQALQHAL